MTTHITPLPTPPQPSDSVTVFDQRAFALLGGLPAFVTETNTLADELEALALAADADAAAALAHKNSAAQSATNANASAIAAGNSQTAAANSASSASTSATNANASAVAAANSAATIDTAFLLNRANHTGNQAIATVSGLTDALRGMRNKIINGAFQINQRNHVSGTALVANQYTLDRWKATGVAAITFSTANNKTIVTIPTGQTLQQIVEGVNLQSGNYVMTWEGTAQGRIGSGSYGASGAVKSAIVGGANTTIEFGPGTVTNVQLELGVVATPFEDRFYGVELLLCQRYYQRVEVSGRSGSGGYYTMSAQLQPPMRATPSIWDFNQATEVNVTSKTVAPMSNISVRVSIQGAGGADSYVFGMLLAATSEL